MANKVNDFLDYKTMNINDIIDWCKENDQVEWLKGIVNTTVEVKRYPRKKVVKLGADGNPVLTKKGKVAMVSVTDKTGTPVVEKQPISFIQIKKAFVDTFMPEIKPVAKTKAPTFYDVINNL